MPLLTIPIYLNFHFPYFNALFLIRKKFKTLDVMKEILLLSFFFLFLVALGFTLARQAFLPLEPLHQPLKLLFLCSFHRVHIDHFFFFWQCWGSNPRTARQCFTPVLYLQPLLAAFILTFVTVY
jgi:hypothetical protein